MRTAGSRGPISPQEDNIPGKPIELQRFEFRGLSRAMTVPRASLFVCGSRIDDDPHSYNDQRRPSASRIDLSSITNNLNFNLLFMLFIICSHPSWIVADDIATIIKSQQLTLKNLALRDEVFTFAQNGSYIQLDAGRDWPINSKREISFRFRTKSAHGLLIYQTFDHSKLGTGEEEPETLDIIPKNHQAKGLPFKIQTKQQYNLIQEPLTRLKRVSYNNRLDRRPDTSSTEDALSNLPNNPIAVSASERLASSMFSASPASAINGNNFARNGLSPIPTRDANNPMSTTLGKDINQQVRRVVNGPSAMTDKSTVSFASRGGLDKPVISSTTISSYIGSLYELYLRIENGRLKIVYEFGSRLNQTYCGKGLNDDQWHNISLKVDPELNQLTLRLDELIKVDIAMNTQNIDEETAKRDDIVLVNSVLYFGGLDTNSSIVRNLKQRLHTIQFIGCIGNIVLKSDQQSDLSVQTTTTDRMNLIKRGCIDECDANNYCLHESKCINHYSHINCDCVDTGYEDTYCWREGSTKLSMLGHSLISYRIYDWRDRHHLGQNRLSFSFRTLASDAVLFFAYGDMTAQQVRNLGVPSQPQIGLILGQPNFLANHSNQSLPHMVTRKQGIHPFTSSSYMSVSLMNGTINVEIGFGEEVILLSNILKDKLEEAKLNQTHLNLSDGRWHTVKIHHVEKELALQVDKYQITYTIQGKNNHLYLDPNVYIGGVPNLLLNETRALVRPFNLRHKFVGCMKSIYFNHNDILLALKQRSPMADYRDTIGGPIFESCQMEHPTSLPLTLRSGKSYLTFPLTNMNQQQQSMQMNLAHRTETSNMTSPEKTRSGSSRDGKQPINTVNKFTTIEFEYRTVMSSYFLAGGHLRDLTYHDLGGFWTLYSLDDCQLSFTVSSGLNNEPEQVIRLFQNNSSCAPEAWTKLSIDIGNGDSILNVTQTHVSANEVAHETDSSQQLKILVDTHRLKSSVELLHQVQIGGDLAKFGESSSLPFSGCIRRININGRSFDSRDLVSNPPPVLTPTIKNLNQLNSSIPAIVSSQAQQQSDVVSARLSQGFISLDSCKKISACGNINFCENGGTCLINELGEPDCDCSRTGYTGKRCHFSIYKQSCHDLYHSGQRNNSNYIIDLDRNGPLRPIRVRCNMNDDQDYVETALSHNLPSEWRVPRSSSRDVVLDVTYMVFNQMITDEFYTHNEDEETRLTQNSMLTHLIGQSTICKQYLRYECKSAPLRLGNNTWFEAPYPHSHRLVSLSETQASGKCACSAADKACSDVNRICNCDANEPLWSDDSADLTGLENVGITRMVFLRYDQDIKADESLSRVTLGDLRCYKSKHSRDEQVITFKTSDAYIEVPGWRRGDIWFSFRTASNPPAIILYQLATSRNHGYFRLTLISDTKLMFEFIINRRPRKLFLISAHKLNNGEWQQVFIEYDEANLRMSVNDDVMMIDLDPNDYLGTFEGPLFIGGAPSKYLVGDLSKRNGFTGCFKGLYIDGNSIDLKSYLGPSMPTVINGCKPSCSKNLCQNGGYCIEYWGSYECECSNSIAHSGPNCEININTNSITFVTPEAYYVQTSNDTVQYPSYLRKNILLNVRTYQETALILYASDHLNNFIQVHKSGPNMVLTFNSNSTIFNAHVPIENSDTSLAIDSISTQSILPSTSAIELTKLVSPTAQNVENPSDTTSAQTPVLTGRLKAQFQNGISIQQLDRGVKVSNTSGSGQPIQVKIERHRLRTTFYVNENMAIVEEPLLLLTDYSQNPWTNPEAELVRPFRPKTPRISSEIYLANVEEQINVGLPGFTGCIQGFSIDNQLFDFNRAHLTGQFNGEYRIGCKMHCDSFPCKNQGICIENWKEDRIQCKCDSTSYVGRLCDEDVAAIFNGKSSHFAYKLSQKKQVDITDIPSANFTTPDPQRPKNSSSISPDPISQSESEVSVVVTNEQINTIDSLEVSFAFSSDLNQSPLLPPANKSSVQVMLFVIRANSPKYFLLGLTHDGSLLIQEDYGGSMSLSRIIKRIDQPFNDGYRHMIKYTRYNQTIQIIADYRTYLPTMNVVTTNRFRVLPNISMVAIGSLGEDLIRDQILNETSQTGEYLNYNGCISNLIVRIDGVTIEPLSEAFGRDFENTNDKISKLAAIKTPSGSLGTFSSAQSNGGSSAKLLEGEPNPTTIPGYSSTPASLSGDQNVATNQKESDDMETIFAREVEQGRCSDFKHIEITSEKRSINEPRFIHMLDARPVYMDPPKIKTYKRADKFMKASLKKLEYHGMVFYSSLALLVSVSLITVTYICILQVKYKSDKFRSQTPFFHKRTSSPSDPSSIED